MSRGWVSNRVSVAPGRGAGIVPALQKGGCEIPMATTPEVTSMSLFCDFEHLAIS
jgi:hypothetical protein